MRDVSLAEPNASTVDAKDAPHSRPNVSFALEPEVFEDRNDRRQDGSDYGHPSLPYLNRLRRQTSPPALLGCTVASDKHFGALDTPVKSRSEVAAGDERSAPTR